MPTILNQPFNVNGRDYAAGDAVDHLPAFVVERLVLHGQAAVVADATVAPEPEPEVDARAASTVLLHDQLTAAGLTFSADESDDALQKQLDDHKATLPVDPATLSDDELRAELVAGGVKPGAKDTHDELVALVVAHRAAAA